MFISHLGTGTDGDGGQEPEESERMKDSSKTYGLGNRSNLNYRPRSQSDLLHPAPLMKPLDQPLHGQQTEEPFIAQTLPSRFVGGWGPLPIYPAPQTLCGQNPNNLIKVR